MSVFEKLFSIIAPHDCLVCGREGSLLCDGCQAAELPPLPSRCYACFAVTRDSRTCRRCRQNRSARSVWVRTEYLGLPRDIVYACKFRHARDAARVIAGLMAECLPALPPDTLLVHIPTAPIRIRQRGFDQSAVIARELSLVTGLRHTHALRRRGAQRQTGAKRATRLTQMQAAFTPLALDELRGKRVLLVDDVLTTGATIEAAAKTLRQAGAKTVDAVVFAQAV